MNIIKTNSKYLGNDDKVVKAVKEIILNKNKNGKYHLIQAGTGTGKSHLMFDILNKNKIQYIFVLPNISVVDNLAKEKGIKAINSGTDNRFKQTLEQGESLVCTVDQLKNLKGISMGVIMRTVLIIDEAHYYPNIVSFRKKAINNLIYALGMPFKNIIMVTATPGPLKLLRRKSVEITRIETPVNTKYKFNEVFIAEDDIDKMKEFIEKLDGQVIMYNNNSKVDNNLLADSMDGWYSINADTPKNNPLRKSIVDEQTIPDYVKVLIATDIFTAGLNIKKSNVKHAILNNVHDPTTFAQFIARIRDKEELMVHYFTGTDAPAVQIDFDSEILPIDNVWLEAKLAEARLEEKKNDADYVAKHAHEFKLVNYVAEDGKIIDFEINEFAVIDKAYRATFKEAMFYSRYKYAARIPEEMKQKDIIQYIIDRQDIFLLEDHFDPTSTELKDKRDEEREKKKEKEEQSTEKVLDIIENNIDVIFYHNDIAGLAAREGLDTQEVNILRKYVRKYEKYDLDVHMLAKIDKDKKYRDRLFYQSIPGNTKAVLLHEKAVRAVKNNHKVGRPVPKFDYLTKAGKEYKRAFDAIWKYDKKERKILGKHEDWKNLTPTERKELKKMFYVDIKK